MITVHCDFCEASSDRVREPHEAKGFQAVRVGEQYSYRAKNFFLCGTCRDRLGLPVDKDQTTVEQLETLLREIIREEISDASDSEM